MPTTRRLEDFERVARQKGLLTDEERAMENRDGYLDPIGYPKEWR
jgi:hypothetical protein